jgi:ribosomal protein S19E (S16A)
MKQAYSDAEVRVLILNFLVRHGRWGAHYYPSDSLVNKIARIVKNNGKRVRKIVKELVKEGFLLLHKKGETVSLNVTRKLDIIDYIERFMKSE